MCTFAGAALCTASQVALPERARTSHGGVCGSAQCLLLTSLLGTPLTGMIVAPRPQVPGM